MTHPTIVPKASEIESTHLLELLGGHGDADLHEVLDDLVNVLAVEAHLGELGRLHLNERSLRQLRNAPSNLSLRFSDL